LSDWFGNEARRIYGILDESDAQEEDRELIELIERHGGEITIREIMRASRAKYPTAEEAETALNELAQIDVGAWFTIEGNGRPRVVFRLNTLGDGDTSIKFPAKTILVSPSPAESEWKVETLEPEIDVNLMLMEVAETADQ
jgi:hypothetical protein